jgi:hypothetical protein
MGFINNGVIMIYKIIAFDRYGVPLTVPDGMMRYHLGCLKSDLSKVRALGVGMDICMCTDTPASIRFEYVEILADKIRKAGLAKNTLITLVSLASGALYQEFLTLRLLVGMGFEKFKVALVDPVYEMSDRYDAAKAEMLYGGISNDFMRKVTSLFNYYRAKGIEFECQILSDKTKEPDDGVRFIVQDWYYGCVVDSFKSELNCMRSEEKGLSFDVSTYVSAESLISQLPAQLDRQDNYTILQIVDSVNFIYTGPRSIDLEETVVSRDFMVLRDSLRPDLIGVVNWGIYVSDKSIEISRGLSLGKEFVAVLSVAKALSMALFYLSKIKLITSKNPFALDIVSSHSSSGSESATMPPPV